MNKYTLFRNYMVNELKISREDIKEWTMKAITMEVQKIIGQLNIESIIKSVIADKEYLTRQQICSELSQKLFNKIKLTLE